MDVLLTKIIQIYFPLIIMLPVLIGLILMIIFYDFKSLKFTIKPKDKRKLFYILPAALITIIILLIKPMVESANIVGNKNNYKINGEAEIIKINNTKHKKTAHFITNHKKYIIEIPKNQDVKKGDIIKIQTDNDYGVRVNHNGYIKADPLTDIDFKYKH